MIIPLFVSIKMEDAIARLEVIAANFLGQVSLNANIIPDYDAVDMAITALRSNQEYESNERRIKNVLKLNGFDSVADLFLCCQQRGMALQETKEKYAHAILTLQAIAQRSGRAKQGYINEWTQAEAFIDCREAAARALRYLGESTTMPNKEDAKSSGN